MRNEDLRTELEYFSEKYDEEREMEPIPTRTRETTLDSKVEGLGTKAKDCRNQEMNLYSLLTTHLGEDGNGLFGDFTGVSTPFVCWIEDYPLPDGLKMSSQVHSYDEKGDTDNYFHLFEGAIHLKAKFQSYFSQQKKFTKIHLVLHNIKQREGESTRAFVTRYTDDTLQILGLHKEQRIYGFVHGLKIRSLMEFLSTHLLTNYKGLMKTNYTWIKAKEVATNGAPNDHRESVNRLKKNFSWDCHMGKKSKEVLSHTGAETPNKRSCEIKATSPPYKGDKEGKGEGFRHLPGHLKGQNIWKIREPDCSRWTQKFHLLASQENTLGLSEKSPWKSQ
ncbi:hypothetical protein Tco_0294839 [Tanacetum coccineum]